MAESTRCAYGYQFPDLLCCLLLSGQPFRVNATVSPSEPSNEHFGPALPNLCEAEMLPQQSPERPQERFQAPCLKSHSRFGPPSRLIPVLLCISQISMHCRFVQSLSPTPASIRIPISRRDAQRPHGLIRPHHIARSHDTSAALSASDTSRSHREISAKAQPYVSARANAANTTSHDR